MNSSICSTWKVGDCVQFHVGYNRYCGKITNVDLDEDYVEVQFISRFQDGKQVVSCESFPSANLKRYSYRINTFLFLGDIADFITDNNGLRTGEVLAEGTDEEEEWYNFGYYKISISGSMEYTIAEKIPRSRVTYIHANNNEMKVLPLKKGAKVEFDSLFGGRTIGKVSDIYGRSNLALLSIKYSYIDEWGDKETEIDDEVTIDKIRLLK